MSLETSASTSEQLPSELEFHSRWSFWSVTAGSRNAWELKEIFTIDSLASFWQFFNAMKMPSEFGNTAVEVALFRHGIQPDWEHEPCNHGGRWSARLDRVQNYDALDQAWINLLLGLVGETIRADASESEILGVALSGRGPHSRRISLWTGIREKDRVLEIGNSLKENLRSELTDKDIGEMLFHDFESNNKSFAVIGNTGKKDRKVLKQSKSNASDKGVAPFATLSTPNQ